MNDSETILRPEIRLLDYFLKEASWGQIRIPKFQRPFIWKPDDMKELFDSLYKGYSIGSLLLWDTEEEISNHDSIGPISIPKPPNKTASYVLDGHQRLATLFGCLYLPALSQDNWLKWQLWFDLETKEFRYFPRKQPNEQFFPLRAILKTTDFLQVTRQIEAAQPSKASSWIEEADKLSSKIKNYSIFSTRIIGGDLDKAVNIFFRLNKAGTQISYDQMVSALTYREGTFDLAQKIDEVLEELRSYGFEKLNRSIILKTVTIITTSNIRQTSSDNIASVLKGKSQQEIDAIFKDAQQAMISATKFLIEIGVVTPILLPYPVQYIAFGYFFFLCPRPREPQKKLLQKWFWITSFSAWFIELSQAMEEIKEIAKNKRTHWSEIFEKEPAKAFPIHFNIRSVRVRAVMILLSKQGPLHPHAPISPIDVVSLLSNEGMPPRIFPSAKSGEFAKHLANRIFLLGTPEHSIQDLLCALDQKNKERVLKSHAIPLEAYEDLCHGNIEAFIEKRTSYLKQLEGEFMQEWGIIPSDKENSDEMMDDAEE